MSVTTLSQINLPNRQELIESLSLVGTGFLVVMGVLCFLWVAISISGKLFIASQTRSGSKQSSSTAAHSPASLPKTANHGIPDTTLALITAAVQTTIKEPHRIVAIEPHVTENEPK